MPCPQSTSEGACLPAGRGSYLTNLIQKHKIKMEEGGFQMTRILLIAIVVFSGICASGCGPLMKSLSKKPGPSKPFIVARATNGNTAGVTTQSTSPLRLFEGGIGTVTTMSLTFNKLIYTLQSEMSPNELRERNPRVTMRFGNTTRTVDVQISETGIHEVQFLNLNVRLLGNINQEQPQINTIEDIESLPDYAQVLALGLFINGVPHEDDGTNFLLTLVKAETEVQQIPGQFLTEEEKEPNEWPLNSPGYNVTWVNEELAK